MTLLSPADARFTSPFEVIEGGSGTFKGSISEPGQGEAPSYQFNLPRRLLRVAPGVPLKAGMVVKGVDGVTYILGQHGSSIRHGTTLFSNFRLFEATGQFDWKGRGKVVDPVTKLPRDTGLVSKGKLWGCYEPAAMEERDRAFRMKFETGRFITNQKVSLDDEIDGRKVSRCDEQLGIYLVSLG